MSSTTLRRPDPDQLLRQAQAEEEYERRGRLKIFLGYASGVGKSYRMLDEGRRRHERGQDVVVGAIQPVGDAEMAALLAKLEVIPLKIVDCCPVMDVETILRRRPGVCLVDGLAYDNPPGSLNHSRWQDVEQILAAGISVITTINIGYIAEHRDEVARIKGKRAEQTVPVAFIRGADEIVVVDAPPSACIIKEGASEADMEGRRRQFAELREIALVLAAEVVDRQLESYLERNGVHATWGTTERILVCLTPRANGARMIESGRRIAEGFHGELIAAYVKQDGLDPESQKSLDANLELAHRAGATVETLHGDDPIDAILEFAAQRGITQIFVGHSLRDDWRTRLFGSPLDRLLRNRRGVDVRVFPH
jgi:two-component system sensor histidine kinase KdpD